MALRYDFVREQVRLGNIRIEHLHTTQMTADALTKLLGKLLFTQHVIRLLNTRPLSSDDLEAYQLSLRSMTTSAKRLTFIHLSTVLRPLRSTARLVPVPPTYDSPLVYIL